MFEEIRKKLNKEYHQRELKYLKEESIICSKDEKDLYSKRISTLEQILKEVPKEQIQSFDNKLDKGIYSMTWKKLPISFKMNVIKEYLIKKYPTQLKVREKIYSSIEKHIMNKKLLKDTDIIYDSTTGTITDIPALVINKKEKRFFIKV